jgi:hypothetical protein
MVTFFVLVTLFTVLNPFWAKKLRVIGLSQALIRLHSVPFAEFNFSRWQSIGALTWLGLLVGIDPSLRATAPGMPALPFWFGWIGGLVVVWVSFLLVLPVLRWWLKRGGRWDGQADLFNLVAASWLLPNVLAAGLIAIGVPSLFVLPLWVYSIWVGGNALSEAIPKASLGYSICGIVLSLIPALLVSSAALVLMAMGVGSLG